MEAALTKPSTSDIYTEHFARFVETFSDLADPEDALSDHMFFVEGGTLAIENTLKTAFDWKIRKNLARGKGEKGTQDPPLPERVPRPVRLLALDDEHGRPAQDAVLPEVRLAAPDAARGSRFPVTDAGRCARSRRPRRPSSSEIRAVCAARPDDIAALILEPIQGEGGDNHFRPELFRRLRALADELEFLLIFDEVQTGVGPDRLDVVLAADGRRAGHVRLRQEDAGLRLRRRTTGSTTCRTTSSRSPRASTRPGAATSSTWSARAKYFEIIAEENLIENARVVGEYLQSPARASSRRSSRAS